MKPITNVKFYEGEQNRLENIRSFELEGKRYWMMDTISMKDVPSRNLKIARVWSPEKRMQNALIHHYVDKDFNDVTGRYDNFQDIYRIGEFQSGDDMTEPLNELDREANEELKKIIDKMDE
jgi:hypothetical protein